MHFLQAVDTAIFHAINGHLPHEAQLALLAVGWLGSAAAMLGWLAVIFVALRRSEDGGAGFCAFAVGAACAVAWMAKHVIGRDRPWMILEGVAVVGPHETSGSFPSAHATLSFALATAVALRWPAAGRIAFPLAILVCLSRVAVGMHYPSDVFAGAVCGLTISGLLAIAWPRPDGVLGRRVIIRGS